MKIIELSTYFHPSVGGVERQCEEIAVNLKEFGHDVIVYTTDATHDSNRRLDRLDYQHRELSIKRFKYSLSLGTFFRFSIPLVFSLFKEKYDILHIHNIHDGNLIPSIIISKLKRKKVVITGHNPYMVKSEKRGSALNYFVRFHDLILRLFFIRFIDKYIALLESEKESVIRIFGLKPEKIEVIPNGIQEEFYEDIEPGSFLKNWDINKGKWKLVVGTASRINFVKGIQNLAPVVNGLKNVLFVFAGGDDGYLDYLKRVYKDKDNVLFTERYLTTKETREFYRDIDVFLLPSVYEPFGMTVVEAMAQGKPVIATDNGGPKEIISEDFGKIINPKDSEEWIKQIKFYIKEKESLDDIALKAKKAAKKYTWKNVITQIEDVFKDLMK